MRSAYVRLPGHPDAVCDIVAETIVDEYLRRDSTARVRLSVAGGRGALFISGDVKSFADFDVSALILRTLGTLGVMEDIEPFVSLEPVTPEQSAWLNQGVALPVSVIGYATNESDDFLPVSVSLAIRIAKRLEELRISDEGWYWLGPDGAVVIVADKRMPSRATIAIETGTKDLDAVRDAVMHMVQAVSPEITVITNPLGVNEARGIARVMGASGAHTAMYGDNMPGIPSCVGVEPFHPAKGGSWLARAAARSLVIRGASAAFVQCVYEPGERFPARIRARDDRGRNLTAEIPAADLSLDRIMNEWWRPGLGIDATRWGFVGEPGFPWETESKS